MARRPVLYSFAIPVLLFLALAACASRASRDPAPILLFNGSGTSPGDVDALERILRDRRLPYATAGSFQLNRMSAASLQSYRLLIVPGGNFETIGKRLTPAATSKIRQAVRNGLGYLGICAGAFFAGDSPYNGLNLTSGVRFPFYAAEDRGIRKAAVPVTDAESRTLDQYWEDGPQLAGWGAVVAKYPDGTPAIVEGSSGSGWVILSGVHPEATPAWRRGLPFTTPIDADQAYAAALILAALNRSPLPHY
jgi:glutamine amidotransferase-like uncharacterized protein